MTDIIIPVWTNKIPEELNHCLAKLTINTNNYRIILCGSGDSMPKNVNQGLKIAKSKYIAILDWDVYVPDGWLDRLIETLESDKSIGIIGAKMTGKYNGLNATAPNNVVEWPTLAGGCIVFRNLGLKWDENFPSGYWADTDFCRQFKDKGYKVYIDGRVEVEHDCITSGSDATGEQYYIQKWGDNKF